ncbi:hypothetical protein FKP32DRAFT_1591594 [Trametes sanguinea]|nr:hypothetical protein FKP32DRAFT_1591594 [Trametes sanguinea]
MLITFEYTPGVRQYVSALCDLVVRQARAVLQNIYGVTPDSDSVTIHELDEIIWPRSASLADLKSAYKIITREYLQEKAEHLSPLKSLRNWDQERLNRLVAVITITPRAQPSTAATQEEPDALAPLPLFEQRRRYFKSAPSKAPSSEGRPSEFHAAQQTAKKRLYCGRPYELSTPPSLLDESLCKLRFHCLSETLEPTPEDIRCFQSLRVASTPTYATEPERESQFIKQMRTILPAAPLATKITVGASQFYADGDLSADLLGLNVRYYIQEVNLEVSTGEADPFIEAIHYYRANVQSVLDSDDAEKVRAELDKVNFPAILVLNFGPYLAIAGAVHGPEPNVEHICCIPLHMHSTNLAQIKIGQRAIAALRIAASELQRRYPTLHTTRVPRADFPFIDSYEDESGRRHTFTYLAAIEEDKRVFQVRREEDDTLLCVKFSSRYSADAHRAGYAVGLAPALLAINAVYDWIVIVMNDLSAGYSNLWDLKRRKEGEVLAKPSAPLEEIQEKVLAGLALLHERGFVHGDVRDVNVLVRLQDAPLESGPDVLLIDWHWSGPSATATYPYAVSSEVPRPEDATSGNLIKPEHDRWMARRLLA